MPPLPLATAILPAGTWQGSVDLVTLTYDEQFLRRKRLATVQGMEFLVDLPETVSLNHGDALRLVDGTLIEVIAAEEPLLEITAQGSPALARIAWHIGNRHTPCQIETDRLLIRRDHVLQDMLARLGAHVHLVTEPFVPEGGAYGHGRTLGHDHGGSGDAAMSAHTHDFAHAQGTKTGSQHLADSDMDAGGGDGGD